MTDISYVMLKHWFADLRVGLKLSALIMVGLVAMVLVGGLGITSLQQVTRAAGQLQTLTELTRVTLEADMAHDAVRGDVQRILLAESTADAREARSEVGDHGAILRDGVERFTRSDMAPPVRAAARAVTPAVQEYLREAALAADAGGPGRPRPASMGSFNAAFTAVEEQLPAVGDALGTQVRAKAHEVAADRDATVRRLVATMLVAAALLAVLGRLVARSITGPLRQVAAVSAALATGDLTQEAKLTSRDEFGQMATGLDMAVRSLRTAMGQIGSTAGELSASAEQLEGVSSTLSSGAHEAAGKAELASQAAGQVNQSVQTVRAGAEQIAVAVAEIAQSSGRAAQVTQETVQATSVATHGIAELGAASEEIGGVVALIESIAEQTNLLALNATIEAARAGEAGKGFAVVAGEVKELAQETARATADITRRISAIQGSTGVAADAVQRIEEMIAQINEYNLTVASAAEEQSATTSDMTTAITETAGSSQDVLTAVETTAQVVETTSTSAQASLTASRDLAVHAARLATLVNGFRY